MTERREEVLTNALRKIANLEQELSTVPLDHVFSLLREAVTTAKNALADIHR